MTLHRHLSLPSATLLGLGSILGTGVFVSLGLVAGLVGPWTALAVLAAGLLATGNALSSAQLAAAHPQSGGTYEYGYRLLHPAAGFTAGWMFLCAKSASAATAALGLSGYALNAFGSELDARGPAAVAVILLTALVAGGLKRSNALNTVVVSITMLALGAFVVAGLPKALEPQPAWPRFHLQSFLEATALMFVAYTGYGRVATLGEEVRDPRRTIPRAIVTTLGVSAFLYLAVAFVGVRSVGSDAMFAATTQAAAPLEVISREFGVPGLPALLAVGAITAMAGVLLNLLLGLSRVAFAMGRRGDLPKSLADTRQGSPRKAVVAVGVLILALAAVGSVKLAWSFSAFTVLVYYALTNLSALRLPPEHRLYPRVWAWGGLVGCAFLAFWVEPRVWAVGLGLVLVGLAWHATRRRSDRSAG